MTEASAQLLNLFNYIDVILKHKAGIEMLLGTGMKKKIFLLYTRQTQLCVPISSQLF